MKSYILISVQLFTAQMRSQTSNYRMDKTGFFIQDSEQTMTKINPIDAQPTEYYILSWRGTKPSTVPTQYRTNGNNPLTNKIFTQDEILTYLRENTAQTL